MAEALKQKRSKQNVRKARVGCIDFRRNLVSPQIVRNKDEGSKFPQNVTRLNGVTAQTALTLKLLNS